MRVMSYNIRSLRDDARAVARVIRAADPDVVCIQEAPRFLFWRRKCRRLAAAAGLQIASGGRIAAANMIMVRPGIDVVAAHSVLFTKDPRLHQRGTAMARVRLDGHEVVIAGTHLDGYPEPRMRHVRELRSAIWEFGVGKAPVVLAGDMNDDPGSAVWNALEDVGADAFAVAGEGDGYTLNVQEPTRRIDGIFAGDGLAVRSAAEIDSADVRVASDHRPVVAEIDLDQ
jgi:endonuclease/exonuclease/phosphatase family metal-dependent hydrolase